MLLVPRSPQLSRTPTCQPLGSWPSLDFARGLLLFSDAPVVAASCLSLEWKSSGIFSFLPAGGGCRFLPLAGILGGAELPGALEGQSGDLVNQAAPECVCGCAQSQARPENTTQTQGV